MNRSLCLLLVLSLLSCNQQSKEAKNQKSKAEQQAEYLRKALKTDDYRNALMNIKRVNDGLDSVKKGSLKPVVVIFVYNNSIGTTIGQADNIPQVEEKMKQDTAYLKSVQLKAASDLASLDSAGKKPTVKH